MVARVSDYDAKFVILFVPLKFTRFIRRFDSCTPRLNSNLIAICCVTFIVFCAVDKSVACCFNQVKMFSPVLPLKWIVCVFLVQYCFEKRGKCLFIYLLFIVSIFSECLACFHYRYNFAGENQVKAGQLGVLEALLEALSLHKANAEVALEVAGAIRNMCLKGIEDDCASVSISAC